MALHGALIGLDELALGLKYCPCHPSNRQERKKE